MEVVVNHDYIEQLRRDLEKCIQKDDEGSIEDPKIEDKQEDFKDKIHGRNYVVGSHFGGN